MKKLIVYLFAAAVVFTACQGQNNKPTTAPNAPEIRASDTSGTATDGTRNNDTSNYERMSGRGYDSTTNQ